MPLLTEFDRSAIRKLLNEANQIRRRSRMKTAAPMLSQVESVLKSSGIEHRAEIVKRILMKGRPLNPAVKAGSAPPTSSHHGGTVRPAGKVYAPKDSTNPKLAAFLKEALSAQMLRGLTGGKTMPAAQALKQIRQPAPPPMPRPALTEHELAKRRRAGVIATADDLAIARAMLKEALPIPKGGLAAGKAFRASYPKGSAGSAIAGAAARAPVPSPTPAGRETMRRVRTEAPAPAPAPAPQKVKYETPPPKPPPFGQWLAAHRARAGTM